MMDKKGKMLRYSYLPYECIFLFNGPLWWLIFKLLDDDTRIAHSDAVGRNVLNDYASGSDGAAFTDCHSGKNCHIAAYPAVSAYGHRLGPFLPRVAFLRVRAWQAV